MYVDIITKAICGKGKKLSSAKHDIETTNPISNVLGCWVSNHRYTAEKIDDKVIVEGAYELHLWYAYDNETKTDVTETTINYKDHIAVNVETYILLSDDLDIIVKVLQQPNCTDTSFRINTNKVQIKTERELMAIVIGETKLKVEAKDLPKPTEIQEK